MSRAHSPNILFVFADQLRGMDLGCAGNAEVLTPNLDRLAAEGTRFDHAYANAPVCTPSRAMLLTGRYPLANRVIANDLPLPEAMPTVGETFKGQGYRTGYIGKWHLDGVPRDRWTPPGPRRHGFDYWAAYNCSHQYFRRDKYYLDEPRPVEVEGYEPVVQTDLALEFIARRDDRPFCLFLSWGPPHDPYPQVPEQYKQLYDPRRVTLRPNARPLPPGANRLADNLDPRQTLADYYAAITALDEQVGRLVAGLAAQGLAEDTILVFTSDHGDMLWSQGRMKKQQPWEESINIPLLVRWPGRVPAGRTSDALVSIVDLAPTLLGLAGIGPPAGMQGEDRSRLVRGEGASGADSVFIMDIMTVDEGKRQGLPEWRGVRTRQYTYARLQDGAGWLLYDNQADPYQQVNLIAAPEHERTRTMLDAELDRWLDRAGDAFHEGKEHIRQLGLAELWNARERYMHPRAPDLIEG